MLDAVSGWLQNVGTAAFTWSALAFIVLNGAGVLMLALRREQGLVNRWTSRFLAANLLLLGTGLGIPLATFAARTALRTLSPAVGTLSNVSRPSADELEALPSAVVDRP